MAFTPRQWQIIQQQIIANKVAAPELNGLTSDSQAAHWQLWTFIQSLASNLNEQAMTVFFDEIETVISQGYPQTAPWIQQKILEFQYNTATPYLVGVNNGVVGYQTIVPEDQIISNCAVVATTSGVLNIKVTTGNPAGALNSNQVIALQSYLTNFLDPRQFCRIVSVAADQLWIAGKVYYNGQLNASISDSVIAALNNYISQFSTSQASGGSFNGYVKVSDIEKVILSVPGVTDWEASQITLTPNVIGASPTNLVLAKQQINRAQYAYSGYLVNDPSNPFSSTLQFLPASN